MKIRGNAIQLLPEEKDLIFVLKRKSLHRIPIFPQPINCEYIKLLGWQDDYKKQGFHLFRNIETRENVYVKPLTKVGDVLKIFGHKSFLEIKKIEITKLQDWDKEKLIREGLNAFGDLIEQELYRNVVLSRYERQWDVNLRESFVSRDAESLLYKNNPWVWDISFSPTVKKTRNKDNRRLRQ